MTEAQLNSLQILLDEFSPSKVKDIQTVFDISSYPHYEDVISNWYAWFMDEGKGHPFAPLFFEALFAAVLEKHPSQKDKLDAFRSTEFWSVRREMPTGQGFLDFFISNELVGENETPKGNVILIENKIRSGVQNNLDDYYESCASDPDHTLALLLTIREMESPNKLFLNITHMDWISAIEDRLGKYVRDASSQQLSYLKEFMINLRKESMSAADNHDFVFYIKNAEKIEQLKELSDEFHKYLADRIRSASNTDPWTFGSLLPKGGFSMSANEGRLMLYFYTSSIYDSKVTMTMWLKGDAVIAAYQDKYQKDWTVKFPVLIPAPDQRREGMWLQIGKTELSITLNTENMDQWDVLLLNEINETAGTLRELLVENHVI